MSRSKISLIDAPPRFIVDNFVYSVAAGEPVVVPMVTMVDTMEAYLSPEESSQDVCRVFLTLGEAKSYWMYVCNCTGMPLKSANFWVTDSNGLILHLISLSRSRKRNIKCFGSAIHENRIFDVETFWTNNDKLMV